jgi:anti-sigma regulatory factor (Ser/Thr protein kinase)
MVWDGTEPVANPVYVPTETYLRSVEPAWTPAPADAPRHRITGVREALPVLEDLVEGPAGAGRSDEVLLAVYELVTNALRAAGEAEVRQWTTEGTVVWEVADTGPGMHQAAAGYVPPSEDLDCGRGLWLARSLADDASVRADGPGTAVRLYFDLAR